MSNRILKDKVPHARNVERKCAMHFDMATKSNTQWDRQTCGCVKADLDKSGRVVIRCARHQGMPTKKGNRTVLYFDEHGIVRDESYVAPPPEDGSPPRPTYVYFARLGNRIKIGISYDPARRVSEFNAELIGSVEGDRSLEARLHHEFREFRTRGEWFKAKKPLLARIEGILQA